MLPKLDVKLWEHFMVWRKELYTMALHLFLKRQIEMKESNEALYFIQILIIWQQKKKF